MRVEEVSVLENKPLVALSDLAQQFSLSVVGPAHLLSSLRPEQAGADFLIFGLSFL